MSMVMPDKQASRYDDRYYEIYSQLYGDLKSRFAEMAVLDE